MKRLILSSLLTVMLGCPAPAEKPPVEKAPAPVEKAPAPKAPVEDCAGDADCELVDADCCGCSAGGKAMAILGAKKASYLAERSTKCAEVSCIAAISEDPSCNGAKPVCKDKRCVLQGP